MFELITLPNTYYQQQATTDKLYSLNPGSAGPTQLQPTQEQLMAQVGQLNSNLVGLQGLQNPIYSVPPPPQAQYFNHAALAHQPPPPQPPQPQHQGQNLSSAAILAALQATANQQASGSSSSSSSSSTSSTSNTNINNTPGTNSASSTSSTSSTATNPFVSCATSSMNSSASSSPSAIASQHAVPPPSLMQPMNQNGMQLCYLNQQFNPGSSSNLSAMPPQETEGKSDPVRIAFVEFIIHTV